MNPENSHILTRTLDNGKTCTICEYCNFGAWTKSVFARHLLSTTHQRNLKKTYHEFGDPQEVVNKLLKKQALRDLN